MDSEHPYNWAIEGPPFGTWTTALGTFGAVMQEQITLHSDATGLLVCSSALRGKEIASPLLYFSFAAVELVCIIATPANIDPISSGEGVGSTATKQGVVAASTNQ